MDESIERLWPEAEISDRPGQFEADSHFEGWDVDPASLDRAIDAAMKEEGHG